MERLNKAQARYISKHYRTIGDMPRDEIGIWGIPQINILLELSKIEGITFDTKWDAFLRNRHKLETVKETSSVVEKSNSILKDAVPQVELKTEELKEKQQGQPTQIEELKQSDEEKSELEEPESTKDGGPKEDYPNEETEEVSETEIPPKPKDLTFSELKIEVDKLIGDNTDGINTLDIADELGIEHKLVLKAVHELVDEGKLA